MDQLFTIGQLSKLYDIKIPTLRYYDEVGILKPARVDPESHYRYYSTEEFERLNVIKYLRALDVPISDIKNFFDARDISTLENLLEKQQIEVEQQMKTLQAVNGRITSRLKQVRDAKDSVLGKIEYLNLPETPIVYLRRDYQLSEDIEVPLTALRRKYGLDQAIFLGKIALSLSKKNILANKFDQYSGILMILESGDEREATSLLSAGSYLRIRFHGTHENSVDSYRQLIKYCQDHLLTIIDDAIEITLIDYGITNDFDKYVTEIRLPVR
ncbi:MerR family transcriptional regulator [Companilactobacillus keshanensis]|uniref:MerR family transcriptional regulator n=1 Tax=Companilactobacillus keshanensis TaxID=2486003 RepID=A0ABW4BUV3_9LACO|nr:MerR family transcriptional regulator [Companilactobacillus keshanensis]